jgi:glucose/mannose-6-phosphate isomerase
MAPRDALDTLGQWESALAVPDRVAEQVAAVAALMGGEAGARLPAHDRIEHVVVLGMGAAGFAGDAVREVAGPFMSVPVVVHKGYGVPNFIDEGTLVLALSVSGDTVETVEAAADAAAAGGHLVAVAAGGRLGVSATAAGGVHVPTPSLADAGSPAAVAALTVAPLVVLERVGLFPGAGSWIGTAVEQLRRRRDQLAGGDGAAAALARRLDRRIPLVYGGGGLGALAALRWKQLVNERAKAPAFWNTVPELSHNELAGWGQHGDVTRQLFGLVLLRHDLEHPQLTRQFAVVRELTDEVVADVDEVRAEGDGALAQLLDLVLLGEVVALHLAFLADVDPGPVPALDLAAERVTTS